MWNGWHHPDEALPQRLIPNGDFTGFEKRKVEKVPRLTFPDFLVFNQSKPRFFLLGSRSSQMGFTLDIPLLTYFAFWYLGNYYYNIQNKNAAIGLGGSELAMTLATAQLAVGTVYALFLWAAPDARKLPNITFSDFIRMLPASLCTGGAHAASVFCLAAGGVAFGQIVKASEPAFAAVVGTVFYGKKISIYKWMCLIPIIGGVVMAALKQRADGSFEMDFTWGGLIGALIANTFAAFKGNENKVLMETAGLKDRIGGTGNQFAIMIISAFVMLIPLMLLTEANKISIFIQKFKTNKSVFDNVILSGLTFYGYNELSTMTLTKISPVSQSVANTAKRVVVIVACAVIFNEDFSGIKPYGCAICIAGVFLDSVIDDIMKPKSDKKQK
jgi:solute carrier family 35 protein E1